MNTTTARTLLAAALIVPAFASQAAEYARVISSTPVTAQVAVPQRVCNDVQQLVQPAPSGAGALVGALIGGAIGNTAGHGFGRAAATGVGAVVGSVIGNQVEANGNPPGEMTVLRCHAASAYENRTVGYDVVYEYAGQRYTTRMANDPGQRLAIDVRPTGSATRRVPAAPVYESRDVRDEDGAYYDDAPVYETSRNVYTPIGSPVYAAPYGRGYYARPYVAPVVSIGIGYGWGWGGHRGWRY